MTGRRSVTRRSTLRREEEYAKAEIRNVEPSLGRRSEPVVVECVVPNFAKIVHCNINMEGMRPVHGISGLALVPGLPGFEIVF